MDLHICKSQLKRMYKKEVVDIDKKIQLLLVAFLTNY